SAQQAIKLFASTRWPACPQHRAANEPGYNLDEERATYQFEAFLNLDFYPSQEAFARGVKTWKRHLLRWPIVGWSWKPVVVGLNAGYPDVVEAVLKAMDALPGKPKVLFDNSCGSGVGGFELVEALLEGVPGERGALDAHGELDDPLQGLEIAQPHAFELGRQVGAVALAFELGLVDRHERLERAD